MSNLDAIRGRQVLAFMANTSGGTLVEGDVVVVDTGANESATTTTTPNTSTKLVGVVQETTLYNGSNGRILVAGYAPKVNVNGSNSTRGHFIFTGAAAKTAGAASARATGAFGQLLTGGTTPTALIFEAPDGSALTNPMTTAGDLIIGGASGTPTRLAAGSTSGHVLTSNGAGVAPSYQAVSGAGVTADTVFMTADVTMTNSNTYYDACSLGSLSAGTYMFSATLAYAESTGGSYTTMRIWDGTTTYGEYQIRTENTVTASGSISDIKIVLGGATTVKLSAACNAAGRVIKDVVGANGTADKATWISYIKIA